jgi:hypothetical protein
MVSIDTLNPKIPAGSGQRLRFSVNRVDGFDGDIRLDITGLPEGFSASFPVLISSGQNETSSVLFATGDAVEPLPADWAKVTILASAQVNGELMTKTVGALGEIKLEKRPQILVSLASDDPETTGADGELIITPGKTVTANIKIERNGFDGDVKFDVDNLPHGVIVDNIGLSGVLVRANETERQIFLTSRPWVKPTSRWIHVVAQSQGNQASRAIRLRVPETEKASQR